MALPFSSPVATIVSPVAAFARLKARPSWVAAFALLAVLSVAADYLALPFTKHVAYLTLSEKYDHDLVMQALASFERLTYVGVALAPVLLLIRLLATAVLLYLSSILFNAHDIEFKPVYSIVVHSETILLLSKLANIFVLHERGFGVLQHVTDLHAVIGLDILLADRSANFPLFIFLNNVNVFSIWYIAVLAIGISMIADFKRWKSGLLVTGVWLVELGFQIAMTIISNTLKLP